MNQVFKAAAAVTLAATASLVCHAQVTRTFDGKQWGTEVSVARGAVGVMGDECNTPIAATCHTVEVADTVNASNHVSDPPFTCAFGGPYSGMGTVWFTFIANSPDMTITTTYPNALLPNGFRPDTLLAVYSGACGQLTEVACNDDINFSVQNYLSSVTLNSLTVGQTYLVKVAAYSTSTVAEYGVEFTGCLAPNDECENPVILACSQPVMFDTRAATNSQNEPNYNCRIITSCMPGSGPSPGAGSLWFSFTATSSNAVLSILDPNLGDSANDTLMAVYTGACGQLTEIACNDDVNCGSGQYLSRIELADLAFGQTYLVRVSSWNENELGEYAILLECSTPGDDCETAPLIDCNSETSFDLRFATDSASDPIFTCRSNAACQAGGLPARGFGTMWFRFTPADPNVRISTLDPNPNDNANDTLLAVYTGSCGQFTQIACNDDINCSGSNLLSSIEFNNLSPTTVYYIQVAGWGSSERGPYQLLIECGCPIFEPTCNFIEPEPCGQDLNGGCYNPSVGTTPISVGQSVCGSASLTNTTNGPQPDYDLYSFTLAQPATIAWVVRARSELSLAILDDGCPGNVLTFNFTTECQNGSVIFELPPGNYQAGVAGSAFLPTCESSLGDYQAALVFIPGCQGDANGDGTINFADITSILLNFGTSYLPFPGLGLGDSNYDGVVDFADITTTLLFWNQSCGAPTNRLNADSPAASLWLRD